MDHLVGFVQRINVRLALKRRIVVSKSQLNVLTDPVFPVATASGAKAWMTFADLLVEDGDCAVAFDWPRADFNMASTELCIGFLSLVHKPAKPDDWLDIWHGETSTDVAARIEVLKPHFNLLGDENGKGPRFCQDFDGLEGAPNAVEALLIDTPGINGQKKNADVLTHRDRFPALGLKAAAIALYTLQQFAPSGGAGNRTSMRGGGPMTTLVLPMQDRAPLPLARMLLANLPMQFGGENRLSDADIARVLPWLRPTITSDGKPAREIAEADPAVHPAQAFFGMPRRMRLVVEGHGICPMTGEAGPLVTGFIQKPWGMNYSVWRHPLTPYRQTKDDAPYTVKPKSTRFGYRDWVGVTVGQADKANQAFPAAVVKQMMAGRASEALRGMAIRLLAAGWSMSNMEAETYLYSVQPLYLAADTRTAEILAETARAFADSAESVLGLLRKALNDALFSGQAKATDTGAFAEATDAFFTETETVFHACLHAIATDGVAGDELMKKRWLGAMRAVALRIYDDHTAYQLANPSKLMRVKAVVEGHRLLSSRLQDTGKIAAALGIAQPSEPNQKRSAKTGDAA